MSIKTLSRILLLAACATPLQAADTPQDPARQTAWGLYVDSREAYQMKSGEGGQEVLLVDVRDPIEIMFTGFADTVDINIPFMTSNRQKWNEQKNVFAMEVNADFEPALARALAARKLSKDHAILLMCRSGGERGAPSARMLEGKGYKRVYVVVDGFEGDTVKEGERKNWRLVNGWKNSGLPWSYTLNKAKFQSP
ncbi:MAG: rhodanese-like domain-containing protein [Candidatus Accumulibacter sp. UW26]|jgi:rhodanese-related sulfurtransferase